MASSSNGTHHIGFDLGGTKMLVHVFDSQFRSRGRRRRRTKGHEGAKAGVDRIIETIRQAMEEGQVRDSDLATIGVGCPGAVDLDKGVIYEAANLGWKNVKIVDILEKEFGCPVVISNDVDAGAYGEFRFGSAQGARNVLGVFPGTGIGGAFIYQGQILRGKTSSCMEIGHMQVAPNGALCGCGRYGCLETVASRLAVSTQVAAAAYRGEAPYVLSAAGTDLSNIRSGVLADAIKNGDKAVEKIIRQAAMHLGLAIANVILLLNPDVVLLGGGLVEALPDLFVETVAKVAKSHLMPTYADSFRVVAAKLGDDATAMGAAAWAAARTSTVVAG
jgi:glucokinase